MFDLNLLTILLLTWGTVTLCLVGMVIYRSVIGMSEETELFIARAEEHLAKEQRDISERMERLAKPIKILGVMCGVLALALFGVWIWEGLKTF